MQYLHRYQNASTYPLEWLVRTVRILPDFVQLHAVACMHSLLQQYVMTDSNIIQTAII
jgi:hypothetical protein